MMLENARKALNRILFALVVEYKFYALASILCRVQNANHHLSRGFLKDFRLDYSNNNVQIFLEIFPKPTHTLAIYTECMHTFSKRDLSKD